MAVMKSQAYKVDCPRWSLPRSRILQRVLQTDPNQEYFVYVPSSGAYEAPIFVTVHGLSRNSCEHARVFSHLCETAGVVMVSPKFTAEQHADYQRLGRLGRGVRADRILDRCVAEVASLTGADATQIYLFGYSGGAQFAHRYLMAHPHRVARAVVASAGWYTFPDTRIRFPYGIRPNRRLPGVNFNPEEFLRVPVTVLVGERDVARANLRSTERVNEQQGKNRVERARKWVATMRAAAEAYGLEPCVTYTEVPATDHSFTQFCQRGALAVRVFHALFEVSTETTPEALQGVPNDADMEGFGVISTLQGESGAHS
jgi:pimeloyl-ACP methyl ester carboxylesterase